MSVNAMRARRALRAGSRGMTLLEVLVAIGIMAVLGAVIYGAFDGMSRARTSITRSDERYGQGRRALGRITRELQSAFLSMHQPFDLRLSVRQTAFVGTDNRPFDRVDFNSFSHRRLGRDKHESDQNELSYFGSADPENREKIDLVRRESTTLDAEPTRGGVVQVLAEDVERFELEYYDPVVQDWVDSWDSSQPAAQFGRLPAQVRVVLALRTGEGQEPLVFETKVPIHAQTPLNFALTR